MEDLSAEQMEQPTDAEFGYWSSQPISTMFCQAMRNHRRYTAYIVKLSSICATPTQIRPKEGTRQEEQSPRVAFVTGMVVQIPLVWQLSQRPGESGLYHMGTFTFFIGFMSFSVALLIFEWD